MLAMAEPYTILSYMILALHDPVIRVVHS